MAEAKKGRILQNFFSKESEKEMEKRVDILSSIVERNKIKNSGACIDDVVASAKNQSVKYKIFY
ncbi:hypothetical protein D5282_26330 [bacterium 1xD8-48]|nr:hypothetical protein [bacterium 1xD8-48]